MEKVSTTKAPEPQRRTRRGTAALMKAVINVAGIQEAIPLREAIGYVFNCGCGGTGCPVCIIGGTAILTVGAGLKAAGLLRGKNKEAVQKDAPPSE